MAQRTTDSRWIDDEGEVIDEDHRGLVYDIETLIDRRRALGLFGAAGLASLLAACAPITGAASPSSAPASASAGASPSATSSASAPPSASPIAEVPSETNGPYPADGSNGINVLDDAGIVRTDIRSSFGSSTEVATGVPLQFSLTVRDAATGDAVVGAGVYVWHCDANGDYSLYSRGRENVNYLRGVAETDASGTVTFTSIFPACYPGRWPHIHFEVYSDVATAVATGPIVKTSQIALPKEACDAVYATSGYERSVQNLAGISLARDNVFGEDGGVHQIATITGDPATGYVASLAIGI